MPKTLELVGKRMIHTIIAPVEFSGGKRVYQAEVRVLAVAGGYAMVRRPRSIPYVADVRELSEPE